MALAMLAITTMAASAAATAQAPILAVDPIPVAGTAGQRSLVVRVTAPIRGSRLPILILSHGNRLSREDYRQLVDWWARAGYVIVHPDHADASTDGFPPAANPPGMWQTRVEDIHRVLDALPAILRQVPGLAARADLKTIGMVGHSLGGLTTMMIDGATPQFDTGGIPIADARVKATLLLAPTGKGTDLLPTWTLRANFVNVDFSTLRGPILLVAGGTDDAAPLAGRGVQWRRDPYRLTPPGVACMVVVAGAGHYLGGINGPGMEPKGDATPERLALVRDVTTHFLDASLKGRGPAFRDWLPTQAGRPAAEQAECR